MAASILPQHPAVTRLALLLCAATLTACTVGPTYQRPDTKASPAWRDGQTSQAPEWPSTDWWHGFGSPELDAYIVQAKTANTDLAAAAARVRQAEQQANAAGAALLPEVGTSFNVIREREQATNSTYNDFHQFSPMLTASYMLDFWGKNRSLQDAAIATANASRHDQKTVELTVLTTVAQTYFQCLSLRERVAVAEGNLASAQLLLKGLRQQTQAGVATALDVAQQETVVATLDAALPPLRVQLVQAMDALAILLGKNPQEFEIGTEQLAMLNRPGISPGLPSELLTRRPDIAEAEDRLIAANANIRVARASYFPAISLTAATGYGSSQLSTLFNSGSLIHSIGAGIAQPIFEGGALDAQYAYSKAVYDELLANYRKAILSAFGNVEDALVAVRQTTEQVARLKFALDKAQRAHHIAEAQLHAGTVTILTVLNTETALFSAQDSVLQAQVANLDAYVSLFGALGGGWKQEPEKQ